MLMYFLKNTLIAAFENREICNYDIVTETGSKPA